jgi:hypothetical protein
LLRIGSILLLVGLAILSPLDDIFLYAVMVPMFGLGFIPFMTMLGLVLAIAGATLLGVHILPLLRQPLILLMFLLSMAVVVYLAYTYDWITLAFGGV